MSTRGTRDGKFAAYHNVINVPVDVSLRLVLLCSQCECSLHDRQYLRTRHYSSLITMKQLRVTTSHDSSWLYLAQRFAHKPFPSSSGRGTPREIAHGSRVVLSGQSSFIADTIAGNVLGLGMSWVLRIILPSSRFYVLGALFWYCTTCTHKARTCSWRKRSHCFLIASIPPSEPSGEVKQYTGLYFQIPSTSSLWPRILQIRSYPPNGIMENWNIPSWSASCGHVGIVCVTLESQDCDTAKNSFKNSRVEAQTANSSLLWDWLGIKGHPHVVFLPKMSQITILASQQNMHWNRSSLMCPHTSAAEYSGPSTDRPHPAWRCHVFTVCKIFGKEVLNRNDCNISKQQL